MAFWQCKDGTMVEMIFDKAEKDETTYCELLMEIPELLKGFNCD